MNHTELFAAVKAGKVGTCYLFYGQEILVMRSALDALRAKILPQGLEALNESLLRGATAQQIIEACETLPMMGEHRLVVVQDCALLTAGKARDEAEQAQRLVEYLPNIPPTACLVFYVEGAIDGRKKLSSALQKQAAAVRFDPLGDAELGKWVRARFQRAGKGIPPQLAAQLSFTAGRDLTQLAGEIEKLIAYLGDRGEVEAGDIEAVVTRSMECTIFQLVDAVVERKEKQAFLLLAYMLENGETRLYVLTMLLRQFRLLMHIGRLRQEGAPRDQQVKLLGMPGFTYNRALDQLRGFTQQQLEEAVALCLESEYAVKSGKLREEFVLDRVIFMLNRQKKAV